MLHLHLREVLINCPHVMEFSLKTPFQLVTASSPILVLINLHQACLRGGTDLCFELSEFDGEMQGPVLEAKRITDHHQKNSTHIWCKQG